MRQKQAFRKTATASGLGQPRTNSTALLSVRTCRYSRRRRGAPAVRAGNLTEAALDRNIELGLLVRDPALAASVSTHFQGLIDREMLRPLPMS